MLGLLGRAAGGGRQQASTPLPACLLLRRARVHAPPPPLTLHTPTSNQTARRAVWATWLTLWLLT